MANSIDYKSIKTVLGLYAKYEELKNRREYDQGGKDGDVTQAQVTEAHAIADAEYKKLNPEEKKYVTRCNDLKEKIPLFVQHFDTPKKIKIQRIFLRGYLGRAYKYLDEDPQSYNGERMRVYLSPDLNSYVEFDFDDYLYSLPNSGGLESGGCEVWLRAKCPKKDKDGNILHGETDIDLTYGGHGYEIGKTKQYIDGDMLAAADDSDTPMMGGRQLRPLTPTCPGKGCAPLTPTCPGKGCGQLTPTCPGKGCDGGGGNGIYDKYSTVIGCDEWDFRNKYNPYRP